MSGQESADARSILSGAKTIVIKVGSAVLTDNAGLNAQVMRSLAWQLAILSISPMPRQLVLVSSGSVAAGKAVVATKGIFEFNDYAKSRHALAAIGQSLLMQAWNESFAPWQILTGQVLLTRDDLRSRERFQMARATFSEMLAWHVLPIVNENDTVSVHSLKFGDNDSLASLLVNLVEADLFVNLTSAPGVMSANPALDPNAKLLDMIDSITDIDIGSLCAGKSTVGSGGMTSKLLAAKRVSQLGVPTLILPGRQENVILRAFGLKHHKRENLGTWIKAAKKAIPRRKFWIAYQSEPQGAVEIDAGAARALLEEGRSLLPGGISSITGDFEKGALVRVTHLGANLGVGFSNYPARILEKIRGLKRHEVAAILGKARYPDVIHRDNLLLDAAI